MGILRRHLETIVVAMVTSTVMAAVPAAAIIANADKVDGFDANQLVRGSYKGNSNGISNFNPGSYQTILSKSANAPKRGILLLWGNVDAEETTGTSATVLQARFTVDGNAVGTTPDTAEQYMDEAGFNHSNSVALSVAVPVGRGTHAVKLQAFTTEAPIFIEGRSITTLFVPFGNGGTQGVL
jgi:hypothetical protein